MNYEENSNLLHANLSHIVPFLMSHNQQGCNLLSNHENFDSNSRFVFTRGSLYGFSVSDSLTH